MSYSLVLLLMAGISYVGWTQYKEAENIRMSAQANQVLLEEQMKAIKQYEDTLKLFEDAKTQFPDINITLEEAALPELWALIKSGDLTKAKDKYYEIINAFNAKVAAEEAKIQLTGTVTYQNKGVAGASIEIKNGEQVVKTIQSAADGTYTAKLAVGKFQIKVTLSGYNEYNGEIEVVASTPATLNIALTKPLAISAPKVSAPTTTSDSNSDGIYSQQTINTDRGAFTVRLLTIDLNQYRMVVDTAADGDCENDCPVLSLEEYVARNAGVAGIHGTYFCPTAYSTCAGKTNSFYFKIHNGRIDQHINWSNGLGNYLPFLRISSGGTLSWHDTWESASGVDMSTGISCRPHLVENGSIVLTANDLDSDKEAVSKLSRGFIGHIGQTIYAGVILSGNLYDSAAVSEALGLEDSFNLDGGGTTALFHNGAYKAGPGRAMPNAIIFKKK